MQLQCAFDEMTSEQYFEILDQIHDIIDIIEIGTPLALKYSSDLITQTKSRYPGCQVLADYKICDGGEHIANIAYKAGADYVTAMAFAHDETIQGVIRSAKKYKRKTVIDMMRFENVAGRSKQVINMGADYVCLHNATDAHDIERAIHRISTVCSVIDGSRISIAGKISTDNIEKFKPYRPAVIIAGSYIARAQDKRKAVLDLRREYNN